MSVQYEDHLWNKVNELHERYKRQQNYSKNLSIVFTKIKEALYNFGKEMSNIVNKKYEMFEEKESSQNKALETLIFNLGIQGREYNDISEDLKAKIIEPIQNSFNPVFQKEKEYYNAYINSLNNYNKHKVYLDNSKKKYDSYVKTVEISIQNYVKIKLNKSSKEEISKLEKSISDNLDSAKNLENNYIEQIKEANKMRLDLINKEKTLLTYYQIIDNDYGTIIRSSLSFYIASIRKLYSSILVDIDYLLGRFKNINILQDYENFIKNNSNNEKPDDEIQFIPYQTLTKYEEKKENAIFDLEVIITLKNKLNGIYPDLNIDDEMQKFKLRKLCSKIFNQNYNMNENQKEKLLNYLKEQKYRSIFLVSLSKERTNGRYKRNKELIILLTEIINQILKETEKENDFENAKNCIILSQTFYYEENEKKIYIFDSIKNNNWLNSVVFWKGIIDFMIQSEIQRNKSVNPILNNESENETKRKISNIGFSQLLPFSSNMKDFGIEKNVILEIIDEFINKYNIENNFAEIIRSNINQNNNVPKNNKEERKEENIEEKKEEKIEEKKEENKEEKKKEKKKKKKKKEKIKEKKEEKKEEIIEDKKEENIEDKKEEKKEEIIEEKKEEIIEEIKEEKIEEKKEEIIEEKKEEIIEDKKENKEI